MLILGSQLCNDIVCNQKKIYHLNIAILVVKHTFENPMFDIHTYILYNG